MLDESCLIHADKCVVYFRISDWLLTMPPPRGKKVLKIGVRRDLLLLLPLPSPCFCFVCLFVCFLGEESLDGVQSQDGRVGFISLDEYCGFF